MNQIRLLWNNNNFNADFQCDLKHKHHCGGDKIWGVILMAAFVIHKHITTGTLYPILYTICMPISTRAFSEPQSDLFSELELNWFYTQLVFVFHFKSLLHIKIIVQWSNIIVYLSVSVRARCVYLLHFDTRKQHYSKWACINYYSAFCKGNSNRVALRVTVCYLQPV